MSELSFAFLYLNLGGEMLYILDQRLNDKHMTSDHSKKVMHDVIDTMYKPEFLESVFNTRTPCSRMAFRNLFEKIAHSSIMKINAASMNKLYDLMSMAVKYQVCLCKTGSDLLQVTLNHLNSQYPFVKMNQSIKNQWNSVVDTFLNVYGNLSTNKWRQLRHSLMNFFQDETVRVSIFMKDEIQRKNGKFKYSLGGILPFAIAIPGPIKSYDSAGNLKRVNRFNITAEEENYVVSAKRPSAVLNGNRSTTLGNNMYKNEKKIETEQVIQKSQQNTNVSDGKSDFDNYQSDPSTRYQLNLLSKLLAGKQNNDAKSNFKLNLFKSDKEESSAEICTPYLINEEPESHVIIVDAKKDRNNAALNQVMKDLDLTNTKVTAGGDIDLLELMDQS